MMYKSKSRAGRRLKALALVPVLALALCLSAVPALRAAVTTIAVSSWDKVDKDVNSKGKVIKVTTKKAKDAPVSGTTEKLQNFNLDKLPDDANIFIDGKMVTTVEEFNALPIDDIESITVTKEKKASIIITTKK